MSIPYIFTHYVVDGVVFTDNVLNLNIVEDTEVKAYYIREDGLVSVKIRNPKSVDQVIVRRTIVITDENITIPAGQQIDVTYDPVNQEIVLPE